jgi:hypothetical protein
MASGAESRQRFMRRFRTVSRRQVLHLLHTFAVDPVGVSRALRGQARMSLQSLVPAQRPHFEVTETWEEELHNLLGAPWPCSQRECLAPLLAEVVASLAARGLAYGRQTYGSYSDGDSSLCRAAWCAIQHACPEVVIETGVARGVTSRVVLEALRANDRGRLWSIDLPYPFDHALRDQIGAAVSEACRARWSYLEGSSSQRLPPLIGEVGHVEVFIHDSLHTAKNTVFEMEQAASAMPAGGVMLVDDIALHKGFETFAGRHPEYQTIVCPSADRTGLFGIAVNTAGLGSHRRRGHVANHTVRCNSLLGARRPRRGRRC